MGRIGRPRGFDASRRACSASMRRSRVYAPSPISPAACRASMPWRMPSRPCRRAASRRMRPPSISSRRPDLQWIAIIFMLLAALPLGTVAMLLKGELQPLLQHREVQLFLGVTAVIVALAWTHLALAGLESGWVGLRHAIFDVVSRITTTGFEAGRAWAARRFPRALADRRRPHRRLRGLGGRRLASDPARRADPRHAPFLHPFRASPRGSALHPWRAAASRGGGDDGLRLRGHLFRGLRRAEPRARARRARRGRRAHCGRHGA